MNRFYKFLTMAVGVACMGYRFNVMLVKDLVFSGAYDGFDYARR